MVPGPRGVERVRAFCDGVRRLPFAVSSLRILARVNDLSREVIRMLKPVGLRRITMGVESFLDADLALYRKGVTQQRILQAFDLLEQEGFSAAPGSLYRVKPSFIVFNPYTSLQDLELQVRFFRRYHIPPKKLATKLLVYPHTAILDQVRCDGLLKADGDFAFVHPGVGNVYNLYRQGLGRLLHLRDRIRFLEKLTSDLGRPAEFTGLRRQREDLDDACLQLFEGLLRTAADEKAGVQFLESWWSHLIAQIPVDQILDQVAMAEQTFRTNPFATFAH